MHKPAVILRSIRKSYPLRSVLDGLNMTVDEGDLFGIVGPKGSGKTTALKVILGQTRIQGGKVIFGPQYGGGLANGRSVCQSVLSDPFIPGIAVSRYLRMIPQFQNADNWQKVLDAFTTVGFTMLESRYRDLTPLQKRQLAIALTLVKDPQILLLDNPFEKLADADKPALGDILRRLNEEKNITVLFTSESVENAKYAAKRLVFFSNGAASKVKGIDEI